MLGYFVILFIERVLFGKYKVEEFEDDEFQVSADNMYYEQMQEGPDDSGLTSSKNLARRSRTYSVLKKKEMCDGLFSPILLVIGLGMHSLMAGIALGLS